ncbi:unnamed protein product, partial [Didymodactylos carnosus]
TDASDVGISGILRPETPKGTKINYYKSRTLSDTEKRYDTIEKEALAIYWCITDLRQYIGDSYISVETDHKPLANFHKKDINNKRVMNWLFKLQDIIPQITEIKHKLRDKNTGPDYLSKHPTSSPCVETTLESDEEHWPRGTEAWEIKPPRVSSFTAQINAVITRQEAKRRQQRQLLPESLSFHVILLRPLLTTHRQTDKLNCFNATQLSKYCDEERTNWDVYLPSVVFAYNHGQHSSSRFMPYQLAFCRKPRSPFDSPRTAVKFSKPHDYWIELNRFKHWAIKQARQNIEHQQTLMKRRYDKNRSNPSYAVDDLVWLKILAGRTELDERYRGPFRVTGQLNPVTYTVEDDSFAYTKRDGKWKTIDAADLVPGDIIGIKLGDVIPADGRLITSQGSVSIDQAAITGESLPVTKEVQDEIFSGSTCKQGEAEALVIGTGLNTFFGRAAKLVGGAHNEIGHLQTVLKKIGNFCICSIAIFVVTEIFVMYPGFRYNYRRGISNILVLLIGGIPIAMPTVLSITLAIGAKELSKHKAIVTHVTAIEELAAVTILCSDKTGTLTLNKLEIDKPTIKQYAVDISPDDVIRYAAYACRLDNQDAM